MNGPRHRPPAKGELRRHLDGADSTCHVSHNRSTDDLISQLCFYQNKPFVFNACLR
jgi:hypothetical protein